MNLNELKQIVYSATDGEVVNNEIRGYLNELSHKHYGLPFEYPDLSLAKDLIEQEEKEKHALKKHELSSN